MGVGKNIRALRERRAYDQAELARAVGIATSTLWRIEHEDRSPRGATLRKIAEILGVEPSELKGDPRGK